LQAKGKVVGMADGHRTEPSWELQQIAEARVKAGDFIARLKMTYTVSRSS